jgi:hypothetical protein
MKIIVLITSLLVSCFASSQVRMTGTGISASNSSAFIDASSNATNNGTVGIGKGLVFPRVDLSTFTFVGSTGVPNNYPSRYDGMIVYNTNVGGLAGAGLTEGTLTEGYWYYYNKSNSVTGGTWKKLQNNGSTSVILNGTSYERAALTGDVTADVNSNTTSIAPNAVTSSKILDGTIVAADLNSMAASSGQVLTFNGSNWAPNTISEVDSIIGNEVADVVTNGGLTRLGAGTTIDPYKLKINDGTANGQILVWDGTKWVAQAAPAEVDGVVGNEVSNATTNRGLVRAGTGTSGDPYTLGLTSGTATGQVYKWNGTNWTPGTDDGLTSEVDGVVGNEVTDAVVNGGLTRSGTGTAADPYKLKINDGTANGQILVWNGTKWVAQADGDATTGNEVTDAVVNGGLTRSGTGTAADPYKLKINDGTANGQILVWNGTKWVAQATTSDWSLVGNSTTDPATNFIGTTDAQALAFRTNNTEKVRIASNGNVGIATLAPVSKFEVNGAIGIPTIAVSANIALDNTHSVVRIDTTAGDVTITLPAASTATNRIYIIVKNDTSSNKLVFSTTINGSGYTFTDANIPGEYKIQSNGTSWSLLK